MGCLFRQQLLPPATAPLPSLAPPNSLSLPRSISHRDGRSPTYLHSPFCLSFGPFSPVARCWVGLVVGDTVGKVVGEVVGLTVGKTVRDAVGDVVGLVVGDTVGLVVGDAVGEVVGLDAIIAMGPFFLSLFSPPMGPLNRPSDLHPSAPGRVWG